MDFLFGLFPIVFFLVFAMVFGTFLMTAIQGFYRWNRNNNSPRLTVEATVVASGATPPGIITTAPTVITTIPTTTPTMPPSSSNPATGSSCP